MGLTGEPELPQSVDWSSGEGCLHLDVGFPSSPVDPNSFLFYCLHPFLKQSLFICCKEQPYRKKKKQKTCVHSMCVVSE